MEGQGTLLELREASRADGRQVTVSVADAAGKEATAAFVWFVFG
ncbi:hypothetical protein [Amycolatopsis tucumanensis]|uniref:Uncharacterized protein n=1 Tax=Amycolatopsis tucumanensis TaxID=401106 RepID=A0ABP7HEI1_9PSEU|nr:hypothetical protein [Amycolatopsis tucumanensis]